MAATERAVALYGPNGAGKSTVVAALGLLAEAIQHSLYNPVWMQGLCNPHQLQQDKPTKFQVEYLVDVNSITTRLRWSLEIFQGRILKEHLECNQSARWANVYFREDNNFTASPRMKLSRAASEILQEFLNSDVLVFSALCRLRNPGSFINAATWWAEQFFSLGCTAKRFPLSYAAHQILCDPHWLNLLPDLLNVGDFDISDVQVDMARLPANLRSIFQNLQLEAQEEQPELRIKHGLTQLGNSLSSSNRVLDLEPSDLSALARSLCFQHSTPAGYFHLLEDAEAIGTKTWLDLSLIGVQALATGGVLVIDEVAENLHPLLVQEFVNYFLDPGINQYGAQLVFTTNETALIGNNLSVPLPASAIWLLEKVSGQSSLLPLDAYRLHKNSNKERQYLFGKYAAIPLPAPTIGSIVQGLHKRCLE